MLSEHSAILLGNLRSRVRTTIHTGRAEYILRGLSACALKSKFQYIYAIINNMDMQYFKQNACTLHGGCPGQARPFPRVAKISFSGRRVGTEKHIIDGLSHQYWSLYY